MLLFAYGNRLLGHQLNDSCWFEKYPSMKVVGNVPQKKKKTSVICAELKNARDVICALFALFDLDTFYTAAHAQQKTGHVKAPPTLAAECVHASHNRQSRLDLCNCQFHGQSPIGRRVWRLDFVHETDSFTNLSDSVCCVQLLFLGTVAKVRRSLRSEERSFGEGGGGGRGVLDRFRKASFKNKIKNWAARRQCALRWALLQIDLSSIERRRAYVSKGCGEQVHRMPCEGRQHMVQRKAGSEGVLRSVEDACHGSRSTQNRKLAYLVLRTSGTTPSR